MRLLAALLVLSLGLSMPLHAQQDDKGFLVETIQDALSGAGRRVNIDGFRGALSSKASFDRMTIADQDGVWLTLEDVVLDWNRRALLRGRLEVEQLSAKRFDLPRLPRAQDSELPSAEATPFSLPDLPVAIDIADFSVEQITLGAPILGQAAQLQLSAQAVYEDGEATTNILAKRTDGTRGSFAFTAGFDRTAETVEMLLTLSEQEGGIAARLLNLPGQPAVNMRVVGAGPLDDLVTDIAMSSDGAERLAGQVTLRGEDRNRRILADIGGDISALLAPRYRAFFGEDISLRVDALQHASGALRIDDLSIEAQAVDIKGKIDLDTDKWPKAIDLVARIASPDGTRVVLPISSGATQLREMVLDVDFDAAKGDAVLGTLSLKDLLTEGLDLASATLNLDGTLRGSAGTVGQFLGNIVFEAEGIGLSDPALAQAVGSAVKGTTTLAYEQGTEFELRDLDLTGADYGLKGNAQTLGSSDGFRTTLDTQLTAQNLSRFSAFAGRDLAGAAMLALKGDVIPLDGMFDLRVTGTTQDLGLGIAQADALLEGETVLDLSALRDETGTFLRDVTLQNAALDFAGDVALRTEDSQITARAALADIAVILPQYSGPVTLTADAMQDAAGWRVDAVTQGPYGAALSAKGLATGPNAALDFSARVPDVAQFTPQAEGPLNATGTLRQTAEGWVIDSEATGPFDVSATMNGALTPSVDLAFEAAMPSLDPLVDGVEWPVNLTGRLRQTAEGWEIDSDATGPFDAAATVQGALTPSVDLAFEAAMPRLDPLVSGVEGPLNLTGTLRQNAAGFEVETDFIGPYRSSGRVAGQVTPTVEVTFDADIPNLAVVVPQANGALNLKGKLRQTDLGFFVDTTASGPAGARALVEGLATGPEMSLTFDASAPRIAAFVPGIPGSFAARGTLRQSPEGLRINTNATGPYASRAKVQGLATGPNAAFDFDLTLPNLGAVVDQIRGPLNVAGTARKQGQAWRLDTDAQGPSGTQARIAGVVAQSGQLNLEINGTAPLGLTEPFLKPRSLSGLARFDLALNGAPALSSLSGRITASGASFTAPNLRLALNDLGLDVALQNSRAQVDIRAASVGGGRLGVAGPVSLNGGLPADLAITLQDLVLSDPKLYRTSVNGALRLSGPLTGGAVVSGQVDVGETNVSVPSTGITSIGEIPLIAHIGAPAGVVATRNRAGLSGQSEESSTSGGGGGGGGFGLDLRVSAPNRIFVRGRGLDAELGGALSLGGTTGRIISSGRFNLIRGRLDILGKRFDLVEGSAAFQGDLVPYIRFVSSTSTSTGDISIIVEGPADAPEVTFASNPEAPQDEVLAQLLFGRNIAEISAFQALQLASAVATLAGRGGSGVVARLREGFGLDDLDVTTTDDGATAVRAGKYISDNVYTDVTAASDGTGEVSLNLDLTPNLTAKGRLGSDGDTGIGLFFEKDY